MNYKNYTAFIATLLLMLLPQAHALTIGAKAGVYLPEASEFDPAPTGSVQLSHEFMNLIAADLAIELEFSRTLSDGDIETSGNRGDYSVENIGAYLSARTAGPLYAIGRIGIVRSETDVEIANSRSSEDDTALSIGAGIGFSLGVRTEVEITQYDNDGDNSLYVSLGFAF